MSEYNHYYDSYTRTRISQCVTEDGKYAVVLERPSSLQYEVRLFNSSEEQATCFKSNVRWYRGY